MDALKTHYTILLERWDRVFKITAVHEGQQLKLFFEVYIREILTWIGKRPWCQWNYHNLQFQICGTP